MGGIGGEGFFSVRSWGDFEDGGDDIGVGDNCRD